MWETFFKSIENKISRFLRVLKNKLDVIFSYSMEEVTDNFIDRKSDFFYLAKNEKIVIIYVFLLKLGK